MPFPDTDCRVLWPSTHASIPAGWGRDTNFDGYYLQGVTGASRSTGGAATHTHQENGTHTHTTIFTHTHNMTLDGVNDTSTGRRVGSDQDVAAHTHVHAGGTTAAGSGSTTVGTTQTTTAASGDDPPYYAMIVIKPDDATQNIPNGAVVFGAGSIDTTDLTISAAYDGKFIKAPGTGADGGGTGGTSTHKHINPHTHSSSGTHGHGDSWFGGSATAGNREIYSGPATGSFLASQHHKATSISSESTTWSSSGANLANDSNEPAYCEVLALDNDSGGDVDPPRDTIIPYWGTAAPTGWTIADGSGGTVNIVGAERQIRCTDTILDVGTTGGTNTHFHTGSSATHYHYDSHGHTCTVSQVTTACTTNYSLQGGVLTRAASGHAHAGGYDIVNAYITTSLNEYNTPFSTEDSRQPYRECTFIQRTSDPTAGHRRRLVGVAGRSANKMGLMA